MSTKKLDALMYSIVRLRQEIDTLFTSINAGRLFFGEIFLRMPSFKPYELGFMKTVSYLYSLYREVAKENLEIAVSHFDIYSLNDGSDVDNHFIFLNSLRTYLQHNLSPLQSKDLKQRQRCEDWFEKKCGTRLPTKESQWLSCTEGLINDSSEFLSRVLACLQLIESSSETKSIVDKWNERLDRMHQPFEFDAIIEIVANDLGREKLDVTSFRKRYFDKWSKELKSLQWGYDFEIEARKLVEGALIAEMRDILPITGAQILERFKVRPGPDVEWLLFTAARLYDEERCSSERLLDRLAENLPEDSPQMAAVPDITS
ncbi:MAG: hypothetical protein IPM25_16185 [Chloracidobacterium sp.]|nr:hypothetical protein [Chloracidobacterium sp.]